ncbi:HepT-like ribonuclease domain-containing protein [Pedobacter segetis]|uniref:HepT-like ribonuclease domain-containing protein n=1 Tax=Pedobacter segetis TaxID=2793069 RepID=UPI0021D3273C|nr:HepT-like ribonuclease domain-containing protein [Pedobacter segetis]
MKLEEKKLLTDILNSIISIDEHLENRKIFEEYISNKTKRRAVERELEIIGEAVISY